MILTPETLAQVPTAVARPAYDRTHLARGIVHLGIGSFHRAHQAIYTETALDQGDLRWGTIGLSLRSPEICNRLAPQSGLYSVCMRGETSEETRIVGGVGPVLVVPRQPDQAVQALAAAETHIVSLTVTEKGYLLGLDGQLDRQAVAAQNQTTLYELLGKALRLRQQSGLPGLTLLSCDNLMGNGGKLAAAMASYLEDTDPELRGWFTEHCRCPNSMVDRIVPSPTDTDRDRAAQLLGLRDEAALITEPFTQWVIEDDFAGPRPAWELAGAQLVADVRPFETAKLRMLNGAHSALAYLGLERGHRFVHEAVADPELRPVIETLMRVEAAATLVRDPELDPDLYADALLRRFGNTSLPHRLAQIAQDGSQKIPQRWLVSLAFHQQSGTECPALMTALAAWIRFLRERVLEIGDPRAEELAALWQGAGQSDIVAALVGPGGLFAAHWVASPSQMLSLTHKL